MTTVVRAARGRSATRILADQSVEGGARPKGFEPLTF
jgi:hypothetical protein